MRTVLVTHRQQAPAAARIGFCQGLICPAPGQALWRLRNGCKQSGERPQNPNQSTYCRMGGTVATSGNKNDQGSCLSLSCSIQSHD